MSEEPPIPFTPALPAQGPAAIAGPVFSPPPPPAEPGPPPATPDAATPISGQLVLWEDADLPADRAVVDAARVYFHNGKTTCRNEEQAAEIAELVLMGVSERAVARECRVSRNTVHAVMQLLEANGKLEPFKRRMSAKLGRLIEMTLDEAKRLLAERKVPANSIPIWVGVFSDKKGALDQDPEFGAAPARKVVTVEELVAHYAALRRRSTADAQSAGGGAQVVEVQAEVVRDPVLDPAHAPLALPAVPVDAGLACPTRPAAVPVPTPPPPAVDRGGGGLQRREALDHGGDRPGDRQA